MGEKTMENITEFYSNENLAQTLYSEWMRQNRIGREVDHLIKDLSSLQSQFLRSPSGLLEAVDRVLPHVSAILQSLLLTPSQCQTERLHQHPQGCSHYLKQRLDCQLLDVRIQNQVPHFWLRPRFCFESAHIQPDSWDHWIGDSCRGNWKTLRCGS